MKWHVLKELAARQAGADLDCFVLVAALQALVLLQVVQLYGVLAALAPDPSTGQGLGTRVAPTRPSFLHPECNIAVATGS